DRSRNKESSVGASRKARDVTLHRLRWSRSVFFGPWKYGIGRCGGESATTTTTPVAVAMGSERDVPRIGAPDDDTERARLFRNLPPRRKLRNGPGPPGCGYAQLRQNVHTAAAAPQRRVWFAGYISAERAAREENLRRVETLCRRRCMSRCACGGEREPPRAQRPIPPSTVVLGVLAGGPVASEAVPVSRIIRGGLCGHTSAAGRNHRRLLRRRTDCPVHLLLCFVSASGDTWCLEGFRRRRTVSEPESSREILEFEQELSQAPLWLRLRLILGLFIQEAAEVKCSHTEVILYVAFKGPRSCNPAANGSETSAVCAGHRALTRESEAPIEKRRFGTKCAGCAMGISPTDLVRRARSKVFHLKCFTCLVCRKQLSTGEELYVLDEHRFVCKDDYLARQQPPPPPGYVGYCGGVGAGPDKALKPQFPAWGPPLRPCHIPPPYA
ncbi:hypothetical protein HPB47_001285, partial [Ixodes persulcatus]